MLNLLLVVIAIGLASVSGYALIQHAELQVALLDQREDLRRLDVAADIVQSRLKNGALAPLGLSDDLPYQQMDPQWGGITQSIAGVPFLYCPYGSDSGGAPATVKQPSGSGYSVGVDDGGFVVSSAVTSPAGPSAVAVIIAARGTGTEITMPRCDQVTVDPASQRLIVPGGVVRVVSRSSQAANVARESGEFAVANNDALNRALVEWVRFKPASATFRITGNLTPDATAWTNFVNAAGAANRNVSFVAEGGPASITAASEFHLPSSTSVAGVSFIGTRFIVDSGDVLTVSGSVGINPGGAAPLEILTGGRLNVAEGATLVLVGDGVASAMVSGDVTIGSGATVQSNGVTAFLLGSGSRLHLVSGTVAWSGSGDAAILSNGAWQISGAGSVTSLGGACFASTAGDYALRPDILQPGSSAVSGHEPVGNTGDPDPAAAAAAQAALERNEARRAARAVNSSAFTCA